MPNNITNIIRADQDVLDALCDTVDDGKKFVDFNTLIPMPDDIHTGDIAVERFRDPTAWRQWSIINWGTKWNAYGQQSGQTTPGELRFETAWNHPQPVIDALRDQFPDRTIQVAYADEDAGANLAVYAYAPSARGHRKISALIEEGTPEAINLASLIMWGISDKALLGDREDPEGLANLDYTPLDDEYDPFDMIKER